MPAVDRTTVTLSISAALYTALLELDDIAYLRFCNDKQLVEDVLARGFAHISSMNEITFRCSEFTIVVRRHSGLGKFYIRNFTHDGGTSPDPDGGERTIVDASAMPADLFELACEDLIVSCFDDEDPFNPKSLLSAIDVAVAACDIQRSRINISYDTQSPGRRCSNWRQIEPDVSTQCSAAKLPLQYGSNRRRTGRQRPRPGGPEMLL